ncbi:MAG: glycosyltransferase [Anaerolineae bacterium]|nr:glycosyltransferase [Anaerolineae bacterium]
MITLGIGVQICITIFVSVLLLIGISNCIIWRRIETYPPTDTTPSVSILVPARNEEHNIGPCVTSLLVQDYPAFEVRVLDDESTDRTGEILTELAMTHPSRLKILHGTPLPAGWLGKHWACHQLAQTATGRLLLFTDADTRHHPHALRDAVNTMTATRADLLSVFPYEEAVTWSEKIFIPLLPWTIFAFLPLGLTHRMLKNPAFSATIGQYMLFRREAYDAIGGYEAVRQNAVDDMALGRRIKAHHLQLWLADGGERVRCRMYHSFHEVYNGFSKNLFAAFGYNAPLFLLVWIWLSIVFLLPWLVVCSAISGHPLSGFSTGWAVVAITLSMLLWGASNRKFHFPLVLTWTYPFTIIFADLIAIRSLLLTTRGKTTWKGRTLTHHS